MDFLSPIYSIGGYGWGLSAPQEAGKAPDPDAKAKPADPLDRPLSMVGSPWSNGYDDAESGSLALYWRMRRYSAVVLAYAAIAGPILAGSRTLEICRRDGTEATAAEKPKGIGDTQASPEDKLKRDLERHFADLWPDILSGLECLNFGFWLQEVEWERRGGLVLPVRFTDFELDEMLGQRVRLLHHNRRFAGIEYDGQRRGPEYVLHNVCNPHLNRLTGVPRAEFARVPFCRAEQSERNGDRLERKASGMAMLIEVMSGKTFRNDDGTDMVPESVAQNVFNALSSNAAALVPMTFWRREDIKNKPDLADMPAVRAKEFNWGSTGPDISAQISRLDAIDKRIFRAYGVPERAVTEAVTGGSRADSVSHGDLLSTGVEQVHAEQVRQFSRQTLDHTLVTNKGGDWRGRMYYKANPLADAEKTFLQDVAKSLATNAADPVSQMLDRKRLATRVELPIDSNWKPPKVDPNAAAIAGAAPPANGKTAVAVDGLKPEKPGSNGNGRLAALAGAKGGN